MSGLLDLRLQLHHNLHRKAIHAEAIVVAEGVRSSLGTARKVAERVPKDPTEVITALSSDNGFQRAAAGLAAHDSEVAIALDSLREEYPAIDAAFNNVNRPNPVMDAIHVSYNS